MGKGFEVLLVPSGESCKAFRTLCKGVSGVVSFPDRLRAQCGTLRSSRALAGAALAREDFIVRYEEARSVPLSLLESPPSSAVKSTLGFGISCRERESSCKDNHRCSREPIDQPCLFRSD